MARFQFALSVKCPRCKASPSRWCRDHNSKCVGPHRERSQAALRAFCAPLAQFIPTRRSS